MNTHLITVDWLATNQQYEVNKRGHVCQHCKIRNFTGVFPSSFAGSDDPNAADR